ncbi:uncharacterized protein LOC132637756 isoform X2 [Lycium barbarum]|uniref:uncharacterized protein LOC132637756 isoform X2 n=1 Tax=Lycium barbarum TaxID=112863 RepID=UPI00293F395F|nr:uncharacterized protein LOC132637756 isoform X2 [Lycium barbarum]
MMSNNLNFKLLFLPLPLNPLPSLLLGELSLFLIRLTLNLGNLTMNLEILTVTTTILKLILESLTITLHLKVFFVSIVRDLDMSLKSVTGYMVILPISNFPKGRRLLLVFKVWKCPFLRVILLVQSLMLLLLSPMVWILVYIVLGRNSMTTYYTCCIKLSCKMLVYVLLPTLQGHSLKRLLEVGKLSNGLYVLQIYYWILYTFGGISCIMEG